MRLPDKLVLKSIYGESCVSEERFKILAQHFRDCFEREEMEFFSAPGRTEIIGNHTDHNGGKVIAASIDMDTIGAALPNHSQKVRIISEGYEDEIVVDLSRLSETPKEQGTVSLVAGMLQAALELGFQVSGFDAYVSTNVIRAAGVSSSASFEMLLCSMINYFFNDGGMSSTDYARIGQYAENNSWDKASGLMDQMACAVGGTILLDFSDKKKVQYQKLDFSFDQLGYDLIIVNTGKGHADLSHEYSSVPEEMKEAAAVLGVDRLCETDMDALLGCLPKIKNDRAILRSLHFFEENRRVEAALEAIEKEDAHRLLNLLKESGDSSWEWLQNCYPASQPEEQSVSRILALTRLFLNKIGDGSCRVHGGGFAGVIMSIVPKKESKNYIHYISQYTGADQVYPLNIRAAGAVHLE